MTCSTVLHNVSIGSWSCLEYLISVDISHPALKSFNYCQQQFTLVLTTRLLLSSHLFFIGQTYFWYPSTSLSWGSRSASMTWTWLAEVQFTVVFKRPSLALCRNSKWIIPICILVKPQNMLSVTNHAVALCKHSVCYCGLETWAQVRLKSQKWGVRFDFLETSTKTFKFWLWNNTKINKATTSRLCTVTQLESFILDLSSWGDFNDGIIERPNPHREEVGVNGWLNKASDFNTFGTAFPVSNRQSTFFFKHDHDCSLTLIMCLLL